MTRYHIILATRVGSDDNPAMAAQYGCLEKFRPESDSIRAYLERVTLYFQANDIGEDKRVPILLSSIGASTYALLRDLVAPDAPGTLTFRRLSEVLTAHFEPKRMVIAERFYFHKRVQAVGESIADFDAVLRKLAIHCEFGATLEGVSPRSVRLRVTTRSHPKADYCRSPR